MSENTAPPPGQVHPEADEPTDSASGNHGQNTNAAHVNVVHEGLELLDDDDVDPEAFNALLSSLAEHPDGADEEGEGDGAGGVDEEAEPEPQQEAVTVPHTGKEAETTTRPENAQTATTNAPRADVPVEGPIVPAIQVDASYLQPQLYAPAPPVTMVPAPGPTPSPTPAPEPPLASGSVLAAAPPVPTSASPAAPPLAPPVDTTDSSLFLDTGEDGFDPDTLANLAALSRIAGEEDADAQAEDETLGEGLVPGAGADTAEGEGRARRPSRLEQGGQELSRDQVRALVEGLRGKRGDVSPGEGKQGPEGRAVERIEEEGEDEMDEGEGVKGEGDEKGEMQSEGEEEKLREIDEEYSERKAGEGKGVKRRKRNRTTLSCTECHRRCDRNIPCMRCVARGIPAMCHMEFPTLPKRQKRKIRPEVNAELKLRVQALEMLIRSGSNMDHEAANAAAMETVMQATRAAHAGNTDASRALASLSADLGGMEQAEQSGLLMEVLQQLAAASMSRNEKEGEVPAQTDDPWSTVPEAVVETLLPTAKPSEAISAEEPAIDLTLPGFREDDGRIFIPPTVRYVQKNTKAEAIMGREPLSISGDRQFLLEATKLAYGADLATDRKDSIAAIQAFSLIGGIRLASTFLSRHPAPTAAPASAGPNPPAGGAPLGSVVTPATTARRTIYVPDSIGWEDEAAIKASGMDVHSMRFQDVRGPGVDWEGMREDLTAAQRGSAVLLYLGGSIPSGLELNASQWRLLALVLLEKQLIPLCIMAFQGLVSGDPAKDAQPMRYMVHEGLPVVLVQSFDATMGIYADSPAAVSVVTHSVDVKRRVESQLRSIARGMHAHPSPWGAHVVHAILSDAKLHAAWLNEIKAMSDRLRSVRDKLHDVLVNRLKTPGTWSHVKRAAGMYCSTLLTPVQVRSLAELKSIHLLPSGAFSLGSLNAARIESLARAIDWAVREGIREADEARAAAVAMELALIAAREAAIKEEAERVAREAREAEDKAREEDTALMEKSIAEAVAAAQREEEEEKQREEERSEMDEAIRRAQERADIQKRADEILASIGM